MYICINVHTNIQPLPVSWSEIKELLLLSTICPFAMQWSSPAECLCLGLTLSFSGCVRPRSKQQALICCVSSWNTWGKWKKHCSFLSSKNARGNYLNGNNRREQMCLKVDVAHQHHHPTHLLHQGSNGIHFCSTSSGPLCLEPAVLSD